MDFSMEVTYNGFFNDFVENRQDVMKELNLYGAGTTNGGAD